jgi:hypothetical protein
MLIYTHNVDLVKSEEKSVSPADSTTIATADTSTTTQSTGIKRHLPRRSMGKPKTKYNAQFSSLFVLNQFMIRLINCAPKFSNVTICIFYFDFEDLT